MWHFVNLQLHQFLYKIFTFTGEGVEETSLPLLTKNIYINIDIRKEIIDLAKNY